MSADIDIDLADREQLIQLISCTPASQQQDGHLRRHNSGIYVTDIPQDPFLDAAAIDYRAAEELGYFKIDLLNMHVYSLIQSPEHYTQLLEREPPWSRLWQCPEWAQQLVHVGNRVDLLASMRPDTIPRMAAFISIIRPGKTHLKNQPWDRVFAEVWDGDDSRGYTFKKAHAIGYSMLVALHMRLIDPAHQGD